MTLKLAGEETGIQEKIELIKYNSGFQDSGDLETGTKTITATSKQVAADYSKSLTLTKPSDARIVVSIIAARLQVTRDSGSSANLNCTVSVDSADGSTNRLFDAVDVQASAGLALTNVSSGAVFNLLSDGAAHTFYFFFWVNAGDSVISLVQLWEGVGASGTIAWNLAIYFLQLTMKGLVTVCWSVSRVGTGTADGIFFYSGMTDWLAHIVRGTCNNQEVAPDIFLASGDVRLHFFSSVATDLVYLSNLTIVLRSVQ